MSGYDDTFGHYADHSEPAPFLPQDQGGWTTGDQVPTHHSCPYTTGTIYLAPLAYAKITALMDKFNKEWLAYMLGKWVDENVVVDDLYIPEQVSSAATVSNVEESPPEGTIGVMHSHVRMGAFFSGTDDEFINSNHRISIVVSRSRGSEDLVFKSSVRKQVACGITMLLEMPVRMAVVTPQIRDWIEECSPRVKDWVYKAPVQKASILSVEKRRIPWWEKKAEVNDPLSALLEKVDEMALLTPQLLTSYSNAFPPGVRVFDAVKTVDNKTLLEALTYMERFGLDKPGQIQYNKYTVAYREMSKRLKE